MHPFFERRIAYGRRISDRAAWLLEAHGAARALAEAESAAAEPGLPEAERAFWLAVAARIARLAAAPKGLLAA